jgi:nucleotide-binding universal stress UspA family protein
MIELPRARVLQYVLVEIIAAETIRTTAEARLQRTAAWLHSRGVAGVDARVIVAPDPAAAILRTVREALPDAIVMSTRGAGGLARLALGSVAEGVVRQSELPVMLLTPRVLAGP